MLHGPGSRTPDPYAQERIAAHIRQGKPTAYTYRGKRLIGKSDLLEFLAATTDEPAIWAGKIDGKMARLDILINALVNLIIFIRMIKLTLTKDIIRDTMCYGK